MYNSIRVYFFTLTTSYCYPVAPVGPVGPCGIVKFKTKLGDVPVIVAAASVPGAPVVTIPIVSVGVSPTGPVGPVAPISPVAPVHTLISESK